MSLVVNDLTKVFGKQIAVNAVSFEARPGEILGFLGPNGAGKSTTMKIATGYLPPTSGSVLVCGQHVVENSLDVRRRVGYLPEHNPLYLEMYVHEYLQFIGGMYHLKGPVLKERVAEMIRLCGLTWEQNKKIGSLSKGFRQRVGLAQALLHDPEVLILDEPTTGLDPNQLSEIRHLIKDISKEKTVIFSTHIMQEVQALCDRVVIINRGNIVIDATLEDLQAGRNAKILPHQVIDVEFHEAIEEDLLQHMPEVDSLKSLGAHKYKVHAKPGAGDIRPAVFRFACDHDWVMIGMRLAEPQKKNEYGSSLEEIFKSLTLN